MSDMTNNESNTIDNALSSLDSLDTALATAVNKAISVAGDTTDFLAGQLPDFITQLLMWHAVYSAIWCGISLVLFSLARVFYRWGVKQTTRTLPNGETTVDEEIIPVVLCTALIIAVGMMFFFSNLEWLQILVAPKVFLVEYAAQLVR